MKKATRLKDLADGLGISITTVSKALNNHPDISEARKREVLELAKKMNYIPNEVAKSFRRQKTKFIGIVLSDNSNPYNARVIKGIEETLSAKGYYSLILNSNEDVNKEIQLVKELRSLNVAGILISPASGNHESTELLDKFDIPYVLVNRYIDKERDNYVVVNDQKVAYMAVKHLNTHGNDKVFFLNYMSSVSSSADRLQGYEKALVDCGLTPNPNWVIPECMNQTDGYEAMKRILEKYSPPFSVLCYSDYIAIGAICALQEKGIRLPEDVAVMGIDDIGILSFVRPGLTTIGVPKRRLGAKSADLLIQLMEQRSREDILTPPEPKHFILEPELIVRETS